MTDSKIWFWDLETYPTIFTATFIDRDSDETVQFVINDSIDQKEEFINFLIRCCYKSCQFRPGLEKVTILIYAVIRKSYQRKRSIK